MDYLRCPKYAKFKHVDRIKEPGSEAMDRGAAIHTLAEEYLTGKVDALPPELEKFADEFNHLRSIKDGVFVEQEWAFTKDWDKSDWRDWTNCWLRVKLDCVHQTENGVLIITDWKTGSFRQQKVKEYLQQLELYALAALLMVPDVAAVKPRLVYLDDGSIYSVDEAYTKDSLPALKLVWRARVDEMLNDTVFLPKPAENKCKYCFFRRANSADGGGQCDY